MEYTIALNRVRKHTPFYIDFKSKKCVIGNKEYVKDGVCQIDYTLTTNLKSDLERLYERYKNSTSGICSEKSKHKIYFKARDDDFTDEELIRSEDRQVARFELEFFVLVNIVLNKEFKWSDLTEKTYFYQGTDKGLVILKEWF